MRLKGIVRQARDAWEVPRDLLLGRYPAFVTGGPVPRGQVPVFVFHSLEAEDFSRKLNHLSTNGYVTLGAEDYFQILLGVRPAPDRAVVLTFDDGRGSLWSVGAPLLRRRGMRGIVFLVPGRVPSRPGVERPQDLRSQEDEHPFLSWEEVESLSRAGVFDFHSHTLTHGRVHVTREVLGFATPGLGRGYAGMDVPLVHDGTRDLLGEEVPPGTPLLRSVPRLAESLRFFEDPDWRKACLAEVQAHGGAAFFDLPDWRARLRRTIDPAVPGRRETPEEREAAMRHELVESRRLIEAHTGATAQHLCYPWHVGGPTARRLAREAGYRAVYWGKVRGMPITAAGGDPQAIARIGEDYVELLPGRGRTTLGDVLARKWRRRVGGARGVTSRP